MREICSTLHDSVDELLSVIMAALVEWSGDREQGDDITLLALSIDP